MLVWSQTPEKMSCTKGRGGVAHSSEAFWSVSLLNEGMLGLGFGEFRNKDYILESIQAVRSWGSWLKYQIENS